MPRFLRATILAGLLLPFGLAPAAATVIPLYDGSLNSLPTAQGWLSYQPALGSPVQQIVSGEGLRLNTGVNGATPPLLGAVGYTSHDSVPPLSTHLFNAAWPVLDTGLGVTLSFVLRVYDEDHASTDRAGFSVILLGADHLGIELGFWEDSIWAQSGPAFTRAESAAFITSTRSVLYALTIRGLDYWLTADGAAVLSAKTRDYSPANLGLKPDPYGVPSFVFLGDNTGSAAADFFLGDITLTIPEPPVPALLAAALLLARRAGRRRAPRIDPASAPIPGN